MASLTLTIGQLNASVEANNAKATAMLLAYADAISADGTNQEKADAVVRSLVDHIQFVVNQYNEAKAITIARHEALQNVARWE